MGTTPTLRYRFSQFYNDLCLVGHVIAAISLFFFILSALRAVLSPLLSPSRNDLFIAMGFGMHGHTALAIHLVAAVRRLPPTGTTDDLSFSSMSRAPLTTRGRLRCPVSGHLLGGAVGWYGLLSARLCHPANRGGARTPPRGAYDPILGPQKFGGSRGFFSRTAHHSRQIGQKPTRNAAISEIFGSCRRHFVCSCS